ncbi:hypothetical protein niasHT_002752 [Heterodera trifolii]|uniref:Uncharacterized protein n=1 Tax=Heterodera trifolii TaxID=157864 RepID=A0ABD2MAB6_9BILA
MSAESLVAFIAKLTSVSVAVTEDQSQKLVELLDKWTIELQNIGGTELTASSSSNLPFVSPLSDLPSTSAASTVTPTMANNRQSSPPPFSSAPVLSSSSNSVQSLPCATTSATKNADQIVVTPKTTMPTTTAFPVVLPMVPQNGLPGMPQLPAMGLPNVMPKNVAKTPTNGIVAVPPIPATVPAAANVMAPFGMRNSFARQKGTPVMPGMVQRRALTKSAAAAACAHGVCGISVARAGGGGVAARPANNGAGAKTWQMMHQRREQRQALSMRRAVAGAAIPSAAYLSAGSKLYQQQQQQQQTTPAVPPSFAYLSAGSKLAFRRHNQQTQQLQQQQKMAPQPTACCSSAADTTNMMETDTADKQ